MLALSLGTDREIKVNMIPTEEMWFIPLDDFTLRETFDRTGISLKASVTSNWGQLAPVIRL